MSSRTAVVSALTVKSRYRRLLSERWLSSCPSEFTSLAIETCITSRLLRYTISR